VVLIATALSFNKPFVDLWVGADKFGGVELSFLLGVATLLTTRFSFFSFLIYSAGEFKKPLVLEASYSITKILLLLVLIQPLGLLAVPLADVIAGVIFLYSFSTRLMASHLRNSIFGSGIYVNGWFELVLLTAIGHGVIALLAPILSWAILGTSAIAFLLTATLVVLAFNTSFIKACVVFPRPRSRTDL
jgi:peptidoglycan biosynthesis protein MviN/MurJ (putative lipid II flippase)